MLIFHDATKFSVLYCATTILLSTQEFGVDAYSYHTILASGFNRARDRCLEHWWVIFYSIPFYLQCTNFFTYLQLKRQRWIATTITTHHLTTLPWYTLHFSTQQDSRCATGSGIFCCFIYFTDTFYRSDTCLACPPPPTSSPGIFSFYILKSVLFSNNDGYPLRKLQLLCNVHENGPTERQQQRAREATASKFIYFSFLIFSSFFTSRLRVRQHHHLHSAHV